MPDPETLAREADGDSVTPARLVGEEEYFPDCRPFLQSGQQPEHLILLFTSGVATRAKQENESAPGRELRLRVSDGGVVVLTGTRCWPSWTTSSNYRTRPYTPSSAAAAS